WHVHNGRAIGSAIGVELDVVAEKARHHRANMASAMPAWSPAFFGLQVGRAMRAGHHKDRQQKDARKRRRSDQGTDGFDRRKAPFAAVVACLSSIRSAWTCPRVK